MDDLRKSIPKFLREKLDSNSSIGVGILSRVNQLAQWIDQTGGELPFFPEYTEHGLDHIKRVLKTIELLITPESKKLLSTEDSAIILLSTYVHDCAMHLTPDAFIFLLNSRDGLIIPEFRDKTWQESWDLFFAEARRWDDRKLVDILGDTNQSTHDTTDTEELYACIEHPSKMGDPDKWSVRYRKFIGEFIRRNHGRLAHDICVGGILTHDGFLDWQGNLSAIIADLSGLVARSHSIKLRATFGYLKTRYHGTAVAGNAHIVYLMTLLRIADYIDIGAERAGSQLLKVSRIRSPISLNERNMHAEIEEVRQTDERDIHAIYILARPSSAASLFRLKKLFETLQSELDVSWAVLGEVYSRQTERGLDKLGIILRRVRSNIDDLEEFGQTVPYVPVLAKFKAADADLLKLLIKPLYGDRPEVGVRELIQNAVDAVLELRYLKNARHDSNNLQEICNGAPNVDIHVALCQKNVDRQLDVGAPDNWDSWLRVVDRGIGMDEEVICHYFLNAGATFRSSERWMLQFTSDDRHSMIARTGRFGVGVLAAFLIGDGIKIQTQHVDKDYSIEFETSLLDRDIKLMRGKRIKPGTTIWVSVSSKVLEHLKDTNKWDHYLATSPALARSIGLQGEHITPMAYLPSEDQEPVGDWRRCKHSKYSAIHWTYLDGKTPIFGRKNEQEVPSVSCNGIVIQRNWPDRFTKEANKDFNIQIDGVHFHVPKINVYDRNNAFPLTILRNSVTKEEILDDSDLSNDIMKDFISFSLARAPRSAWSKVFDDKEYNECYPGLVHKCLNSVCYNASLWASTASGCILSYPEFIFISDVEWLVLSPLEPTNREKRWDRGTWFDDTLRCAVVGIQKSNFADLVIKWTESFSPTELDSKLCVIGAAAFITDQYVSKLNAKKTDQLLRLEHKSANGWRLYKSGEVDSELNDTWLKVKSGNDLRFSASGQSAYVVLKLSRSEEKRQAYGFANSWQKKGMPMIIPYNFDERVDTINGLSALEPYFDLWVDQKKIVAYDTL